MSDTISNADIQSFVQKVAGANPVTPQQSADTNFLANVQQFRDKTRTIQQKAAAGEPAPIREFNNISDSFASALTEGLIDSVGGLGQAGASIFSSKAAKSIGNTVNLLDSFTAPTGGVNDSNGMRVLGYGIGQVAPWLAFSFLDSAPKVASMLPPVSRMIAKAATKIPAAVATVGRDLALGGAAGYSSFQKDWNSTDAYMNALYGSLGGATVGKISRSLQSALFRIPNAIELAKRLAGLGVNTKYTDVHPEAVAALNALNAAHRRVHARANMLYGIAKEGGAEAPTIEAGPIRKDLTSFLAKLGPVQETPSGQQVGGEVRQLGGLVASIKHDLITPFEIQEMQNKQKLLEGAPILQQLSGLPNSPNNKELLKQLGLDLSNNEPDTVFPNQLAAAISRIKIALRKTGITDRTKRSQLQQFANLLTGHLNDSLEGTGESADSLIQKWNRANVYYRTQLAPFHQLPGYKDKFPLSDPASATGSLLATGAATPNQMFDRIAEITDSNDPNLVRREVQLLGGVKNGANTIMRNIMVRHGIDTAMDKGTKDFNLQKFILWAKAHRASLNALGKGEGDSILGLSNLLHIAAHKGQLTSKMARLSTPFLSIFAVEKLFEGDPMGALKLGTAAIFAPKAINAFADVLESSQVRHYLAAAAKLPPGSPQMLRLFEKAAPIITRYYGAQQSSLLSNSIQLPGVGNNQLQTPADQTGFVPVLSSQ